ncbi:MAG: ParB/RepB/Spo0J family partition protein [Chloroflexi bacterium]|nr:ParB/RepB/Spo0J family partition protein [Chloroflexota bacterium]MBV9596731.1 ParB/RepB/Spo0J family partition protein [Chloroflexota bacterium]
MSRTHERGLGRGLGALIPPSTATRHGLRDVPVDAIRPNPWQPRTSFDDQELEELAQSIREHGVLQPVLVSQQPDGTFQLITGERRWRAVQKTGMPTLPAMVKETTPQASLELALVENIQRRDLNPLEEAHAFRQLLDEHGLTQEQLGQRVGKSRVSITNTLRLLHLPEPVREALAGGSITEGHARAILMASGETARLRVLERVLADHLSVRDTEALARQLNASRVHPPTEARVDPDVERLEDAFRHALGTRVRLLKGRRGGGRLVITFFSDEELQGLYEAIVNHG